MARGATRRTWVKFFITGWLHGSIRWQLEAEERGVWADLICMAGECGQGGLIADNDGRPLPWSFIANRLNIPEELLERTVAKCKHEGRLVGGDDNTLKITNWAAYQSEYERQKPHRKPTTKTGNDLTPKGVTTKDTISKNNFNIFWEAYPRKQAKVDAERAFKSLNPSEDLLAVVIADISSRKQSEAWQKDGGKYIPLPASYLRGKRWEDETKKEAPNGKDRRYPEEKLYTDPDSYRLPVILSTDPAILKLHENLKGEKPHPPDG